MTRLAPAFVLAGVALVGAAGAASANGHHDKPDTGHTPIVVCHNVTHNPHIIVVDDDSTKLHAHLVHRTQAQLMDLVEGYDGTAAQIRALCVPKPASSPTSIPTTTPTEVPSSTTTTSTIAPPTDRPTTETPAPTSTSTTSRPTSPSPTSSTSGTPTTTVGTSSPAGPPSVATTRPGASVKPSSATTPHGSPTPSVPSSTVAPPELAHTGFNAAALAAVGAGLLAAGIAVSRKGARREH